MKAKGQEKSPSPLPFHGEAPVLPFRLLAGAEDPAARAGGGRDRPLYRGARPQRLLLLLVAAGGVHLHVQRRDQARVLQVQGAGPAAREAGRRLPDQARRGALPLRLRRQAPLRTLPRRLRRRPRHRTRRVPRTLPSSGQIYD